MWESYIRYVGAGAVAIGGLIALVKSFPTIFASFWQVFAGVFSWRRRPRERTDKDFPFILLALVIAGLGYAMWRFPQIKLEPVGAIAVIVFTFFFVTVSSRLVGIVGQSSNPISGMTIATILATALVFKYFVVGDLAALSAEKLTMMKVGCLSAGALVCIAIAVAGDCSQDLKTGYLLKATPYKQQMGEMIGVLTSVFAISGLLLLLNSTFGFGDATPEHPFPLLAPQANIMKILVDGVLGGEVPWTLIMIGGAGAVIVEMLGLPALPFAVGLYLPLGLSTPIMVGGIVRWAVDRRKKKQGEHDPGVLSASGLVAGYGLTGVTLAGVLALIVWLWNDPHWMNPVSGVEEAVSYGHLVPWLWVSISALPVMWGLSDAWWDALPFFPFLLLVVWLWWCARKRPAIALPLGEVAVTRPPEPTTSPAGATDGAGATGGLPTSAVGSGYPDETGTSEACARIDESEPSNEYEGSISAAESRALGPIAPVPESPISLDSQEDVESWPGRDDTGEEMPDPESEHTEGVERFEPPDQKPTDEL